MTVCAVVRSSDNVVVNTIVAEPTDTPPDGHFLVKLLFAGIGDVWDGNMFTRPEVPVTEGPTVAPE